MISRLLHKTFLFIVIAACAASSLSAQDRKTGRIRSIFDLQIQPDALVQKPQKAKALPTPPEAKNPATYHTGGGREGIDVSRYQGTIDWDAVATEKIAYVYIKATEGETLVDPQFERNLREARRAGLKVGSYHFYRAHVNFDRQLQNFTSNIRPDEQDLLPIIDVEHTNGVSNEKFVRDLRRFAEAVTKYYGRKPVMYTFQNFYNKHFLHEFKDYVWMIAKYRDEEPILHDNLDYVMWQYTSTGRIRGIRGDVDRSMIMEPHTMADILY